MARMTRRGLLVAVALIASLVVLAPTADARPAPPEHATGWYLALGDSLAAGYQPGAGDDKIGGYVGHVLADLQATDPKTKLVNLGCSGETSVTLLAGGRCAYDEGSQLAQAVEFLHAHRRTTRLVTIDIGANDVTGCVATPDLPSCAAATIPRIAANLSTALAALRGAAPDVTIVVLDYYDPFLAAWLMGGPGQTLAQQSVLALGALNSAIAAAAGAHGARVALVSTQFQTTAWTPTVTWSGRELPTNVATICTWTWMCVRGDIHANDAGYAAMAAAVAAAGP